MKQAHTIISHIKSLPQFKKLQIHHCYKKFIASLAPKHKKGIAFVYVREHKLFVALSHPGFKMELHYNKDILKDVLNMLTQVDNRCKALRVSDVILFNAKHLSITKDKPPEDTVPHYKERSLGEFKIESQDRDIIQLFEEIKSSIKRQRRDAE